MMEEDQRKEIEEIIGQLKCPKDFRCCKSGFHTLCKAKGIGLESFLQCLEENPRDCKFSIKVSAAFSKIHLCQCPLRVYIAKKLKK
jgi:hypothetical protein